ncbi:MAG: NAD+ synthase [Haloplanus sp.]
MSIDPDRTVDHLTDFLADRHAAAGTDGYVVGVSGGVDSAVAVTLAVRAVGADAVLGLLLPAAPSDEANVADAHDLCDDLGIERREVNIEPAVDLVRESYGAADLDRVTAGNLQARLRAVYLYLAANRNDLLVLGATNRSEHLLGYYTKYGDGAADVRVLADHYKTEVYDIARALGLDAFAEKTPSAELWEGQTDAGELGATYATIDPILRSLVDDGRSVAETARRVDADEATVRRFASMIDDSEHKRSAPPTPGRR